MTRKAQGKRRPLRPVLTGVVVLFFFLLALAGSKSYRDLVAARERQEHLEERIREAQSRVEILLRRVDRLRHDPTTLERLAREELGMIRPGEVVIMLPEEAESRPPAPPAP